MIRAMHTAATGMAAQQAQVDNSANNLANVNTNAFKRSEINFQDLLYSNLRQPGSQLVQGIAVPSGLQIGNGVRVSGNSKIFAQGTVTSTSNPLDVAISGDGFFQITAPDGTIRYSRDGAFSLNASGQLVNSDGYPLSPTINIPNNTNSITIGTDGTVSVVSTSSPNTSSTVGTITLARFPNPGGLSAQGRNLFLDTPASGTATIGNPGTNGNGLLQQGFLEQSNVDVVQELVNLILAQRAYEFNDRAVRVSDEMLQDSSTQLIR